MHAAEKTDYEKELFNKEAQLVFGEGCGNFTADTFLPTRNISCFFDFYLWHLCL